MRSRVSATGQLFLRRSHPKRLAVRAQPPPETGRQKPHFIAVVQNVRGLSVLGVDAYRDAAQAVRRRARGQPCAHTFKQFCH